MNENINYTQILDRYKEVAELEEHKQMVVTSLEKRLERVIVNFNKGIATADLLSEVANRLNLKRSELSALTTERNYLSSLIE